MRYLLDTNAVSDSITSRINVAQRVAELSGALMCTSVIVIGEVRNGIARMPAGRRRDELSAQVEVVLVSLEWHPVPLEAGLVYALMKVQAAARGFALSDNDLWIAATARLLDPRS